MPDDHYEETRRPFNPIPAAGALFLVAIIPQLFLSILWWPFASIMLFAAFVLCIVGLCQGRVADGVIGMIVVCLIGPALMVAAPIINAYALGKIPGLQTPSPHPEQAGRGTNHFAPMENAPPPTATPYTPPPPAFAADVKQSQAGAIRRHPELAKAGSDFNRRFISRYKEWQERHDWRLDRSDWPERLANEIAND